EDDVVGRERLAVVPLHPGPQPERQVLAVAAELPGLGEIADGIEVVVERDEAGVDLVADFERGAVARERRNEARHVSEQRVEERVAVGGRHAGRGRRAGQGAVGATRAGTRRDHEQSDRCHGPSRRAPAHPNLLRYFAGAGGVAGAAGAGVAGAVAGGAAGAEAGGASRTTDDDRSPPRIARGNDVSVKMIAIAPVILPST